MRNSIIVFIGLADPEKGILCEPVQHVQPHLQAGPLRLHFPSGKGEEHHHHQPLQGWGSLKNVKIAVYYPIIQKITNCSSDSLSENMDITWSKRHRQSYGKRGNLFWNGCFFELLSQTFIIDLSLYCQLFENCSSRSVSVIMKQLQLNFGFGSENAQSKTESEFQNVSKIY